MSDHKPRVLATRLFPPAVEARLQANFDAVLNPRDVVYDADQLVQAADGCTGLMCAAGDALNAAAIARFPDTLRIIATFSVGYEHIDVAAAAKRGIVVTNTPDVLTDATADITLLCLLGAARRAQEGIDMLRGRRWEGWAPTQLMGTHVTGKRLGIVGMGRIGQAVADRARAFRMTIHYSNRRRLPPDQENGAIFHADPEAMLGHCDFLSLNCPLTADTRHWLNAARIARLPDGAIVVNTARGPVVDDAALIAAVRSGKLASVGLDVFDGEPRLNPGYHDLPTAFLLPHMGSATLETRNAMGFRALDNLEALLLRGETPPHVVTVA
ncbi:D-glycerate dehydrogenase [Reyranella sp. CPCC 100927]|uniref:2-hydroxyacid dehydrogenase n=1 Tax=Reyranella sp. CPCC 100927 TaxID=2599616 RepID=UPI0011B7A484|nr:D-glycerate dehydrogenase [Reyranella sp. CPCC 100927]TWT03816.1 D-glycerate dehydrogenase [Reyranella sp. CPCC 100927]